MISTTNVDVDQEGNFFFKILLFDIPSFREFCACDRAVPSALVDYIITIFCEKEVFGLFVLVKEGGCAKA